MAKLLLDLLRTVDSMDFHLVGKCAELGFLPARTGTMSEGSNDLVQACSSLLGELGDLLRLLLDLVKINVQA